MDVTTLLLTELILSLVSADVPRLSNDKTSSLIEVYFTTRHDCTRYTKEDVNVDSLLNRSRLE